MSFIGHVDAIKRQINETFQNYSPTFDRNTYESLIPIITQLKKSEVDHEDKSLEDKSLEIEFDLDLAFRSLMGDLLKSTLHSKTFNTSNSPVIKLLIFSFDFAMQFPNSLQIKRIPFELMEDVLENQTIQNAEEIWTVIESMVNKITNPNLFSVGKFAILKTCNSLSKKLSKSCNTEFCGRVLMFLAAIYPITEKSAVNSTGKINTSNVTYYEDETSYLTNTGKTKEEKIIVESKQPEALTATNSTKNKTTKPISKDNLKKNSNQAEDGEEKEESGAYRLTYQFYESFWKFQSCFITESKLIEISATSLPSTTSAWNEFITHAKRVLELFEVHGYTTDELQQAKNNYKQNIINATNSLRLTKDLNNNAMEVDTNAMVNNSSSYLGCKFLTSSQLFSLQLRDPLLRQQVAVQILFFIHCILIKVLAGFTDTELFTTMNNDLLLIHGRVVNILETTPPNGEELMKVIRRLLSRENHWYQWKFTGSNPFEKTPLVDFPIPSDINTNENKKRIFDQITKQSFSNKYIKLGSKKPLGKKNIRSTIALKGNIAEMFKFNLSDENVKEKARKLVENINSFEDQLQKYVDAEDPDCGIADEYHPKHDHIYCWKTRRYLAANKLFTFEAMADGDIAKAIRKLNGENVETGVVAKAVISLSSDISVVMDGIEKGVKTDKLLINSGDTIAVLGEDEAIEMGEVIE
eukprot:gene12572-16860_t